jgi:hypothetical protein
MKRLLGYQIADLFGENIQGDDNDPTDFASFEVMSEATASVTMQSLGPNSGYLLMPIFEGDVEEPTIV